MWTKGGGAMIIETKRELKVAGEIWEYTTGWGYKYYLIGPAKAGGPGDPLPTFSPFDGLRRDERWKKLGEVK